MKPGRTTGRNRLERRGFTLIEVLVTVLIIAILVSLLLPAIAALRRAAMRNRAASRAMALVNAITQYKHEYNRWPGQTQSSSDITFDNSGSGRMHETILDALVNNPRNIYFGEIGESIVQVSGNSTYMDPWDRPYVITIDCNGDGSIEMNSSFSGPPPANVSTNARAEVGIMSWGQYPDRGKWIYTWIR